MKKDPIAQLDASKSSIKDLFSDLLNETKYLITVKILLKKYKQNEEIEFAAVYFNPVTKLLINHKFKLEKYFQEILYRMIVGLIKDQSNQSNCNTLIFRLISYY